MKKSEAIKKEITVNLFELRSGEEKGNKEFFEAVETFAQEGEYTNGSTCHFDVSDYEDDVIDDSEASKVIADVLKEYGVTGECVLIFSW